MKFNHIHEGFVVLLCAASVFGAPPCIHCGLRCYKTAPHRDIIIERCPGSCMIVNTKCGRYSAVIKACTTDYHPSGTMSYRGAHVTYCNRNLCNTIPVSADEVNNDGVGSNITLLSAAYGDKRNANTAIESAHRDEAIVSTAIESALRDKAIVSTAFDAALRDEAIASTAMTSALGDEAIVSTAMKSALRDEAIVITAMRSVHRNDAIASTAMKSALGDEAIFSTAMRSAHRDETITSTSIGSAHKNEAIVSTALRSAHRNEANRNRDIRSFYADEININPIMRSTNMEKSQRLEFQDIPNVVGMVKTTVKRKDHAISKKRGVAVTTRTEPLVRRRSIVFWY